MFKTEIEGKFDGENLIADDGSCYRVPANYASKSRLVEGDALVLKIDENGSFVFKQINPMPRKMLIADVYEDERKTYVVANETEYKVVTYQDKKAQMLVKTQAVADTFVPLNNARSSRNNTLYLSDDNLVDTANKAKDYLFTILDASSAQYKAIAKIKFKKR